MRFRRRAGRPSVEEVLCVHRLALSLVAHQLAGDLAAVAATRQAIRAAGQDDAVITAMTCEFAQALRNLETESTEGYCLRAVRERIAALAAAAELV